MNVFDTLFPKRTQAAKMPKKQPQNRLTARRNRLRDLENAERLERRDLLAIDFVRTTPDLFFIDTGQGRLLSCEYEQVRITNNDPVAYDDLWVKASNFTGGVVGLAPNEDGIYNLGALGVGQSDDAYFYLSAQTATSVLQQHTVTVYDGDPREGGTPISGASANFGFRKVLQTIEASSNQVNSVSYDTTSPTLGSILTMTVTGQLGQTGGLNALFSPASFGDWQPDVFELDSTTITITSGANAQTKVDNLYFAGPLQQQSGNPYTATYRFRVEAPATASTTASPTQYVGAGDGTNDWKHHKPGTAVLPPVPPAANTTILQKLVNGQPAITIPDTGTTVTYTLRFTNSGDRRVTLDSIRDALPLLPAAAVYVPGTSKYNGVAIGNPDISGLSNTDLSWIGPFRIEANSSAELTFQATIPAVAGVFVNSSIGRIGTTQIDATLDTKDNVPATATVNCNPVVNLAVTKDDGTSYYVPGTSTTYTIVVSNSGPSTLKNGKVVDALPPQVSSATWTATYTGVGSTGPASGTGGLNETISLAAGGTATFLFTVNTKSDATGDMTNTVTVSPPAGTTGNTVTATDTDTAKPTVQLAITKTDGVDFYVPGTSTTYTIIATNSGPSFLANGTVFDALPFQVSSATWTATYSGTGSTGPASGTGGLDETISLAAGGTATFLFTVNIKSDATGDMTNTVIVAPPAGTTGGTATATDTDTAKPTVQLAVSKTDGVDFYVPGTSTTYTIIATNSGPSFLANGKVVDALPPQVSTASWTATYSGVGSTGPASGSGPLNETISLAAGGAATFLFTVNIKSDATGDMTNTVTVSPPAGTTGNTATATDTDTAQPDVNLSVTKTDGVDFYVPGTSTTYTIIATNAGPSFLANGKVVDALPAQVSTATWTATYTGIGSTGPSSGTGALNETISLAGGGTATFLFTVNIKSDATGDMTNTVTVSPPQGTTGNTATATDTDTARPDVLLSVTKTDGVDFYVPGTSST
jgi:uncharacterized repeat protein (TIGR01451 family)